MPPEMWTLIGNMGLPAILIMWGVWFFQTQAWPKFTSHLDKVGEMVDAMKITAAETLMTKDAATNAKDAATRAAEGVEELLIRIPAREKESA